MKDTIKLLIEKQYIISKLKKEAKLLHRENPQQSLMMCQDLIAQKHGYLHWHELHTLIKNRLLNLNENPLVTTDSKIPHKIYLGIDSLIKQKLYIEPNFTRMLIDKNQETGTFISSLFKEILTKNKSQLIYCCKDSGDSRIENDLEVYAREANIKIYHMDFINQQSELYFDFKDISSGTLTELLYNLVIGINGSGSDMWAGRAISFISALNMALVYMRNNGEIELTPQFIMDSMMYTNIVELSKREDFPNHVKAALKSYLKSLSSFKNHDTILEQHGHLQMQYMKVLLTIQYKCSHLFEENDNKHEFHKVIQSEHPYIIIAKFPNIESNFNNKFFFALFFEYWKTNWNKFDYNVEKNKMSINSYFCVDVIGEINMNLPSDRLNQPINFINIDSIKNADSYSIKYESIIKITPLDGNQIIIK